MIMKNMDECRDGRVMTWYEVMSVYGGPEEGGWAVDRFRYIHSKQRSDGDYSEEYKSVEKLRNRGMCVRVQWELPDEVGRMDNHNEPVGHYE
jgi:hypothetical protein